MIRRLIDLIRAIRAHPFQSILATLVAVTIALNVLAYVHARAMTTYVRAGTSTKPPENLRPLERAKVLLTGITVARPENTDTPADHGMRYTTEVVTTVGRGAVELWWIDPGNARGIVVVCHGYAASKSSQLPVAEALRDLGWASVLLDFQGSGGSPGNTTSLGFHEAYDVDAAEAFAQERARGRPVVVFGTSMGGAAVLRAVQIDAVDSSAVIVEGTYDRLLTTIQHRFGAMGVPSWPSAQFLVFWGGVRGGFDSFEHNPRDYAASVTTPFLVLQGDHDPRVSVAEARSILAVSPSDRKELHVFEGLGHGSYVTERPAEWRTVVGRFLDGL